MDIILIENLEMSENIRNWLRLNFVADAAGALEVLQGVQNQSIEKPQNISTSDIAAQISIIEKILGGTEGYQASPAFKPPPMGVIIPEHFFSAKPVKKEIDDE
jgi:hypothetical protein